MASIKKIFSAIWRTLLTIFVTLIALAFISTSYTAIEYEQKRLQQFGELELLYEMHLMGDSSAQSELAVRYVNLHESYYIHNEGKTNQHYSFKFLFADDNPRMSGRTVYSYSIPNSFSHVPIISLASEPRIYALDPTAQYDHQENETHGVFFFVFICLLILFPYLAFLGWLWRGHKRIA